MPSHPNPKLPNLLQVNEVRTDSTVTLGMREKGGRQRVSSPPREKPSFLLASCSICRVSFPHPPCSLAPSSPKLLFGDDASLTLDTLFFRFIPLLCIYQWAGFLLYSLGILPQRLGKLVKSALQKPSSKKTCQTRVGSPESTKSAPTRRTSCGAPASSKGDRPRVPMKAMAAVAAWATGKGRHPEEIAPEGLNSVEKVPTGPSRRSSSRPKVCGQGRGEHCSYSFQLQFVCGSQGLGSVASSDPFLIDDGWESNQDYIRIVSRIIQQAYIGMMAKLRQEHIRTRTSAKGESDSILTLPV